MHKKALCVAVALTWGIAGCAWMEGEGRKDEGGDRGHHGHRDRGYRPTAMLPPRTKNDLECKKGGRCDVEITVGAFGKWCQVSVSHPTIWIPKDNVDMEITWILKDSPGYSFPPRDGPPGVFIKGPYDGTFSLKSSGPTTFTLKNKRQHTGTRFYDYGVYVYDTNSKYLCDVLDPVIVNEM